MPLLKRPEKSCVAVLFLGGWALKRWLFVFSVNSEILFTDRFYKPGSAKPEGQEMKHNIYRNARVQIMTLFNVLRRFCCIFTANDVVK
jgi:hypothetical protein